MKVKIIDAIMGSGKTYNAIESMKSNKGNYVYVTPFLDEVERVKKSIPSIKDPKISYDYNPYDDEYITIYKRDNLLRLANSGYNLATTHSLFKKLKRSDYSYFTDYDLILDEVIMPIKVMGITPDDIKIAIEQGLIVVNQTTGEVTYTGDEYYGKYFAELKDYCDTANVVYVNEKLLVWVFPPEIFKCFKSVTVLTYLFEGSLLSAYFKYYNIPYVVDRTDKFVEKKIKKKIKGLLNIYSGKYNDIGKNNYAFSVNWLNNKPNSFYKKMSTQVKHIFERTFKTNSKENGYTTFKKFKNKAKGGGYTKGFIPVNERATNKYSHKESMVYLANRFLNPNIKRFFDERGIKVDEEKWALCELIQWVFRGSIRNDKKMNLFIPSKRMRSFLIDWLDEV